VLRAAWIRPRASRCSGPGLLLVVLLIGSTACGSEPASRPMPSLPTLPEAALPGYSVQTQAVDAEAIATEVADVASFTSALAGMRSAVERRFSSRRAPEQQVIARTLRFATPSQAEGVVAWVRGHAADILGPGAAGETVVDVSGAVAFSHDPSGCCPGKELVWWLVAWSRGTDAFVVMVGGTHVRPSVVGSLTTTLDQEARPA
jgi:hypothetical protein